MGNICCARLFLHPGHKPEFLDVPLLLKVATVTAAAGVQNEAPGDSDGAALSLHPKCSKVIMKRGTDENFTAVSAAVGAQQEAVGKSIFAYKTVCHF